MPIGKMSDYGFEEEEAGLVGHQSDSSQGYITVIPVEYPTRRNYSDYETFTRSATISREFLRERSSNDFLRREFKGSADHLDKAAGFYPSLGPSGFDVSPMSLDTPGDHRRTLTHRANTPTQHTGGNVPQGGHMHSQGGGGSLQNAPPQSHTNDSALEKKMSAKVETERKKISGRHSNSGNVHSIGVEVCIYLHNRLAIRVRLDDGLRVTAQELLQLIAEEEETNLPKQATEVFAIWMVSPLLEVQLKPYHRPLEVRRQWVDLLQRFGHTPSTPKDERYAHEPKMVLRRNIFFSKREEVKIRDAKILELLYEEAQWNMRTARYPCELSDYEMLAGMQARLELGPYDHNIHTPSFFRQRLLDYLPEHACRLKFSDFLSFNSKSTPEIRIIEQFRSIPSNVNSRKLVRKYLEFSWSLPYYGSAFFYGQIEVQRRGLTSWLPRPDLPVLVAINGTGVTIIDPDKSTILLSLRYDEMSWDFARPSNERSIDCLPCLFLQFAVVENGRRYSKILQIFSKQAVMMDALINAFVNDLKRRATQYPDDLEGHMLDHATEIDDVLVPLTTVSRKEIPDSTLCNKLERLCLTTFTEEGVRKGWLKGLVSVEAEEKEEDEEDSEEYFWKAPTTRRSKKIELEEQEERQINDLDVEVEEKISSKDKNSSGTSLVPSDNSSDSSSHDSALSDYLAISKPSLSTSSVVGCPSTLSCLCCGSEGDLTDSGAECYSLKIMYTEGENAYRSPYYGISSSKDEQECSCSRNIQFRY